MIERVRAMRYDGPLGNGRTKPVRFSCYDSKAVEIDLIAKLSGGCDMGERSLGIELLSACLAADLKLPIPKPYLVEIPDMLFQNMRDSIAADYLTRSSSLAFGSTYVGTQFSTIQSGFTMSDTQAKAAWPIFLFDGIIQNVDRRVGNPNCLVKGDQFRIIDHEAALITRNILGWKPPWTLGGFQYLAGGQPHIFLAGLRGRDIDSQAVHDLWSSLRNDRFQEYED